MSAPLCPSVFAAFALEGYSQLGRENPVSAFIADVAERIRTVQVEVWIGKHIIT